MISKIQTAIIKKDIGGITANKRMLTALIIVPIVMAVMLPAIFIFTILFTPVDSPDMQQMLQMLDFSKMKKNDNVQKMVLDLILNYVMPLFFVMIPIMASSVMAASSFVGEKEKSTLETLLYCPMPLKDIFSAKIFASFLLSMAVSVFSFIIMMITVQVLLFIFMGSMVLPNINWLIMMLLVSPAAALIAINLIVRSSAKAQSFEESQQTSVFLVLPVILLVMGQFTGIMMISALLFFFIGAALALIAVVMFKGAFGKFNYEALLR